MLRDWLVIAASPFLFAVVATRLRRSVGVSAVWMLLSAVTAVSLAAGFWSGSQLVPDELRTPLAHVVYWCIAIGGPAAGVSWSVTRATESPAPRDVERAIVVGYAILPVAALLALGGLLLLAGLTCRGTGCY
jgi:hypothetical protein